MRQTKATTNSVTIGLDIGYGAVKAVTSECQITFPSLMGYAHEIDFNAEEIAQKYPGEQITDDDGSWFVGYLAQKHLKAGHLFKMRGRAGKNDDVGMDFRLRLAKAAIGKLLVGKVKTSDAIHIRLATGLPVDHMRNAAALKQAFIGRHHIKTDGGVDFVANIVEVMVMPQPVGALYSQTLLPTGSVNPYHVAKRTGLFDVGMYSLDVAYDDDGEYIAARSGSIEGGAYVAHERIEKLLSAAMSDTPDYRDIEAVLRHKKIKLFNELVDYSREVEDALDSVRTAAINLMAEKWGAAATIEVIYVVGGITSLVLQRVQETYRVAQAVDDPQFAVAQGYFNYAMSRPSMA